MAADEKNELKPELLLERPDPGPQSPPTGEHTCDVCGRIFQSRQGLSMHHTRTHKRGKKKWNTPPPAGRPDDQRPVVDEGKTYYEGHPDLKHSNEQAILDMIEDVEYVQAVSAFLPVLAEELRRRGAEGRLDEWMTAAFLTLFLDVSR